MLRRHSGTLLAIFGGLAACAAIAVTVHASIFAQPTGQRTAPAAPESALVAMAAATLPAMPSRDTELTIYCGRAESLVGELIERFSRDTGIKVNIKYGSTGHLAALMLEEGDRSPADIFFAQDPGGLGLLAARDHLAELPEEVLDKVQYNHRDPLGRWIGVTGRVRTVAFSTERIGSEQLPASILELTQPRWRGRIGWAPSNASFQALVTAMRHELGEPATEQWLRGMIANEVRVYPRNSPIIQAIADGEIDLGLVNHYYLHRFRADRGDSFPVGNHVPAGREGKGDIGGMMLISGVGMLTTAKHTDAAQRFIEYLLSSESQQFFANSTFEYPLASDVSTHDDVPSLSKLPSHHINLVDLADLEATVALLRKVNALR